MLTLTAREYRCTCNKLLFKGVVLSGVVEMKCPRCHAVTVISNYDRDPHNYSLLLDRQGVIVEASVTAERNLGYASGELVGRPYTDVSLMANLDAFARVLENFITSDTATVHAAHSRHQKKDGTVLDVHVRVSKVMVGGDLFVLCAASPASPEASALTLLPENMDSVCDAYCEINPDLIFTNATGKPLLGYEPHELVGRTVFDVMAPTASGYDQRYAHFIAQRDPFRIRDAQMRHKDGTLVTLELYFMPMFGIEGTYRGYRILVWPARASAEQMSSQNGDKKA